MARHYNVDFSENNRLSRLRKKVKKVAGNMSVKVEIYGKIYENMNELHVFAPKRVDEFIRSLPYPPTEVHWDSERLGVQVPFVGIDGAHIIYAL